MSITGANNPFPCTPVVFSAANQILQLGTITRDGNQFTFSVGFKWKINGVIYQNTSPVLLTIAEASEGFFRIDNAILNTSNSIELQQGLESETIALQPVVPDTNILLTSWNISGTTIGDTSEPITGTQFKQKIENTRYKSRLSGENVIIPFQAAGQSHYMVSNATLVSVAGFTTAGLTTPMYEGQDVIFENQTGHDITLKGSFGVDTSFVIGADLIVPNNGKLWFRFRNNELELIDKNWFGIHEVATPENLGEFIDGLDSKTDIKDVDEFILSDSEDSLKSKKTRFSDLKTNLKSYFDNFYLSLSIFNDFVTSVNEQIGDVVLEIPTKTSDLENDSNFVSSNDLDNYVPYTGAVQDVDLGENNFKANSIQVGDGVNPDENSGYVKVIKDANNIVELFLESNNLILGQIGVSISHDGGIVFSNFTPNSEEIETGSTISILKEGLLFSLTNSFLKANKDGIERDILLSGLAEISDILGLQAALDNKPNLGETSSTAYRGDRGKTAYEHSQLIESNPHETKLVQLKDYSSAAYSEIIDTDSFLILDSATSLWKRFSFNNLKSKLKAYFDTLYTTSSAVASQISTALVSFKNANYLDATSSIQTQLDSKLAIETPTTTGVNISFTQDRVYGSLATPETGNITANVTGAKLGVTNIIIHNSGTAPTFSSQFKKLSGSGNYVTGVVNYIYCTYISTTEIIYSINQRA